MGRKSQCRCLNSAPSALFQRKQDESHDYALDEFAEGEARVTTLESENGRATNLWTLTSFQMLRRGTDEGCCGGLGERFLSFGESYECTK